MPKWCPIPTCQSLLLRRHHSNSFPKSERSVCVETSMGICNIFCPNVKALSGAEETWCWCNDCLLHSGQISWETQWLDLRPLTLARQKILESSAHGFREYIFTGLKMLPVISHVRNIRIHSIMCNHSTIIIDSCLIRIKSCFSAQGMNSLNLEKDPQNEITCQPVLEISTVTARQVWGLAVRIAYLIRSR